MTGIDRLRTIAGAWDEWGLGGALAEIADEIERERAEDCYRMGIDCGTVWRVVADMERHCLGHEGMEDSPVARWARELRGALKSDASDGREVQNPSWHDPADAADVTSDAPKVTRDPAEDVSMSASDGEPLEVGQTVWDANGDELVVVAFDDGGHMVACRYADVGDDFPMHGWWSPSQLTHTKPEPPDSWDALWDDIEDCDVGYESFMRRCRALAERERGD